MTLPQKKISGVILAAGTASRMGETKQLLSFKDKPILEHVINNARHSNLHEIIIVLGHCAKEIEKKIDLSGTKVVMNKDYLKGQSTSLIKGIKKISPHCEAAMFLLADQPLVTPDIINQIINAFNISQNPIIVPYYKKQRGNPVIIDRSLFPDLKLLSGDTGPRVYFTKFRGSILKVPVNNRAVLIDVDTKKDYRKLKFNYK
jgi:molybdenum cofactor cytidylyltransferase